MADLITRLTDDDIRTSWTHQSASSQADDDATDPGDASDADEDGTDADQDGSDSDSDADGTDA
jgi:hypothetical protein